MNVCHICELWAEHLFSCLILLHVVLRARRSSLGSGGGGDCAIISSQRNSGWHARLLYVYGLHFQTGVMQHANRGNFISQEFG